MTNTTLVIFGAGASAGAFPSNAINTPLRWGGLPVTSGLFEPRPAFAAPLSNYREIQPVVQRLRTTTKGLEQEMEALVAEAATEPQRLRQLLACRYYLREILTACAAECHRAAGGVTYYAAIADLLRANVVTRGGHLLVVTFNYDVLVDLACLASGLLPLGSLDGYVADATCLIKLHGSTNWAREVRFTDGNPPNSYNVQRGLVEHAARIELAETRWVYEPDHIGAGVPATMVPAIAVPVVNKTDAQYECPGGHIDEMKRRLPEVSRILIVGWKGQEPHFILHLVRALARREVHILVANGSAEEGDLAVDRFRRAGLAIAPETMSFLNSTRGLDFGQLVCSPDLLPRWLSG